MTEPGARLVDVVGRVPVLVIRGGDGELRAFANVCRHRGYPVAPSSGCEKVLQCRYHAWTYNFDGTLRKAPGAEHEPGFETEELGLKPLACHVWRGVVFVNGDRDCEPFESVFPRIEEEAAAVDLDLRRYTFHSRITATPGCDWKLFYDNIVECYHCPTMHGQSLNSRYDSQAFAAVEWEGPMRVGHTSIKKVDPKGAPSHHTIQLFPGIVILQDRFIAQICRFAPGDAGDDAVRVRLPRQPRRGPGDHGRVRRPVERDVRRGPRDRRPAAGGDRLRGARARPPHDRCARTPSPACRR